MNIKELKENIKNKPLPNHIAFILDGNGRWAKKRLLPRVLGHKKGVETLIEIAREVKELKIKYMTVFAFSTENWNRPKDEVDYLMNLIKEHYEKGLQKTIEHKVRLKFLGFKENVPQDILILIEEMENLTKDFDDFTLSIAFNYGATQEIISACKNIAILYKDDQIKLNDIDKNLFEKNLLTKNLPPLDFLVRTSGEIRISNFLLFQIAYSELYFTKTLWPDFHKKELYLALSDFQKRNRRFGGIKNEN